MKLVPGLDVARAVRRRREADPFFASRLLDLIGSGLAASKEEAGRELELRWNALGWLLSGSHTGSSVE